ncbi:MAG: SdrD B-like domain-containing protein [Planctomycetota bacterium]|jgi:protocatechuate 3,4-dioxygenase beta subunit
MGQTSRSNAAGRPIFQSLEPRLLLSGTIEGQVWYDLDADNDHDTNDPGLDGWIVELVDADTDSVVASQTTFAEDLNGDGQINPFTERGLYRFEGLNPGAYRVREVTSAGWQTSLAGGPADPIIGQQQIAPPYENADQWPGLAMLSSGGYVVTWPDQDADGYWFISGRRYHINGTPNGDVFQFESPEGEHVSYSHVVGTPSGGFLASWLPAGAVDRIIYCQLYSADGSAATAPFAVGDVGEGWPPVALAFDGTGGFAVAWSRYTSSQPLGHEILVRRYATDGTPTSDEIVVSACADHLSQPSVLFSNDGTFTVIWAQEGIYDHTAVFRRFDASNVPLGPEQELLSQVANSSKALSVAGRPDGSFIVASSYPDGSNWTVVTSFASDGTQVGEPQFLATGNYPEIDMNSAGDFVVSWVSSFEAYAQVFDANFNAIGASFRVSESISGQERYAVVGMNEAGQMALVWLYDGPGEGYYPDGLYTRTFKLREEIAYEVTIVADETADGYDFGATTITADPALLRGQVYYDLNRDGVKQDDETRWPRSLELVDVATGAVVDTVNTRSIDLNGDGSIDPVTEEGVYTFSSVSPGVYEIRMVLPSEYWGQTSPDGDYQVLAIAGMETTGLDFGTAPVTVIHGSVFNDHDADGVKDPAEPTFNDWTVELVDAATSAVIATTTTDNGTYRFEMFPPGDYHVRAVAQPRWEQTTAHALPLVHDPSFAVSPMLDSAVNASIAMDGQGNSLIVWEGQGIYARRLDSSGRPLSNEFQVNMFPRNSVDDIPAVAMNGSGRSIVVWQRGPTYDWAIVGRIYDVSGLAVTNEILLATGEDSRPTVAMNDTGRFVVAWATEEGIHAQRFDVDGSALGPEILVEAIADVPGDTPFVADATVACNGTGEFVVVWQGSGEDYADIYARVFAATGVAVGDSFVVNSATDEEQRRPDVAFGDNGRFVVAWEVVDNVAGDGDGNNDGIYWRLFATDGSPLTDDSLPYTNTTGWQGRPAISMNNSGQFSVAWCRTSNPDHVWASLFDADGRMLASETIISDRATLQLGAWKPVDAAVADDGRVLVPYYAVSTWPEPDFELSGIVAVWSEPFDSRTTYCYVTVPSGDSVFGVDFGFGPAPVEMSGQIFGDRNENGTRDGAEVGSDGWTIELVDPATEAVIATTTTASVDLNEDGWIDPATERGRYAFTGLTAGDYEIRQVVPAGWLQTSPMGHLERTFAAGTDINGDFVIVEFDPTDGAIVNSFAGPQPIIGAPFQGLAVGPDSLFYVDAVDTASPVLWELDLDTGAVIDSDVLSFSDMYFMRGMAYLDGLLYIHYKRFFIAVWDPATDTLVAELNTTTSATGNLAAAPDWGVLFDTTLAGDIVTIDPATGAILSTFTPGVGALEGGLAYAKGELLAVDDAFGEVVHRIDPLTGAVLGSFTLDVMMNVVGLAGDMPNPAVPVTHSITLGPDEIADDLDFGNLAPAVPADFNGDGLADDLDIDLLFANLGDAAYDLDGDGDADSDDVDFLVHDILNTEYGDANLDGYVDATDLAIFKANFGGPGTWAQGNLNGDGYIDATDLAIFKSTFGFARPAEPAPPVGESVPAAMTLSTTNYSPLPQAPTDPQPTAEVTSPVDDSGETPESGVGADIPAAPAAGLTVSLPDEAPMSHPARTGPSRSAGLEAASANLAGLRREFDQPVPPAAARFTGEATLTAWLGEDEFALRQGPSPQPTGDNLADTPLGRGDGHLGQMPLDILSSLRAHLTLPLPA